MEIKKKDTQWAQDTCLAIRPLVGVGKADALWKMWLYSDEDGREELAEQLQLLSNSLLHGDVQNKTPVFHPPAAAQAMGDIGLGSVHYNGKDTCPFGLRPMELAQHTSIVGRTGSGKSNAAYLFALNLTKSGIPWLCLDWKQSWRRLRNMPEMKDLRVFTIGRDVAPLQMNPLIPPQGIEPKNWIKSVVEVIMRAYFCGDGVAFLLTTILDELYQKDGVYSGTVTRYPTFRDVLQRLKAYPAAGRVSLWQASAIRAVHALCFGAMDGIVNAGNSITMEELLSAPTVIELETLGHADKLFVAEFLMLSIYAHRLVRNERNQLRHILIIEEAHHLLSRLSQRSGQPASIVEVVFREIRELSEGIVFLDQMPSEISKTALANTYTTISMNLKGKQDVATIEAAMLLQDDQPLALGNMEIGKAVVKLQGRVREPFMIRIPEIIFPQTPVTDDLLREAMKPHIRRGEQISGEHEPAVSKLTASEKPFLQDVAVMPDSGVVARLSRLGISGRQGSRIRQSLLDMDLIEEVEKLTSRGRKVVLRLTEKGVRAVKAER